MEPMIVTNSNRDNRIDDCVAIIASDGNNENLVQERCPLIKMRRIEKAKRIGSDDNSGLQLQIWWLSCLPFIEGSGDRGGLLPQKDICKIVI